MVKTFQLVGFRWMENPEELKGNIIMLAKEARRGYLSDVGKGYFLELPRRPAQPAQPSPHL